jgi:S-adenosylmethionine:tRNA ribosyltransferase-isomerase
VRTADFDYDLPASSIAQTPAAPRDSSRLLVLDRAGGTLRHHVFRELPSFLRPEDLLVLNETRVIPARLMAHKQPGGGRAEVLLLKRLAPQIWEALVGGKGMRPGVRLRIEGGPGAVVAESLDGPRRVIRFDEPISPLLSEIGRMPLPPYIHTPLRAPEDYQTVYAREPGSAAAPTAGLHFTPELLDRVRERGIQVAMVTLHIGLDTFAPVTEDDPAQHTIHTEWCRIPSETGSAIAAARARGGRVVAVGTTVVRSLETAARSASAAEGVRPFEGPTDLYLLPGHQFRAVDALVTNFHLPRSTLLMLVSAFAGRERVLAAYQTARDLGYRFYSFGDAMLIV